jgi:UDP-glucose 4-epimerase
MSPEEVLKGKVILVTGGTGSFGNAVVSRLLSLPVKKVIVFSRDEKKQFDMEKDYSDPRLKFVIGDVRDRDAVMQAMRGVDLVFHAAAYKQVPNCEFFPIEAVKTNVLGANNVIGSAIQNGVERVVVLSTDKAVYPINVMGMTKALMERLMIATSRDETHGTVFCGTRYGNVMYTRGSVLPHFVKLIKEGKPLTITDGRMTRFMMSLEQSVDLVLYALANGEHGDIYVRKAPASTVADVAQAFVDLFNHGQGVKEIGIRPGEKLHETLISAEELHRAEDHGDYYRIRPESPRPDYSEYFFKGEKIDKIPSDGYTSSNTRQLTLEETKELLLSLPEIRDELNARRENGNEGV